MNMPLRDAVKAVLACSLVSIALVPAAYAQDTDQQKDQKEQKQEPTVAEAESEQGKAALQEVVVTGSRIRRTEFSSPAPVTVITNERSALAGLLTTDEILRQTTVTSGDQINDSFAGFVTDGGAGANTISLRGLGAQRTLVLVNGKRWVPSGVQGRTNSVDLTSIPSSIISRIEILKDGASSIYGADAVAGVINVITKTAVDGLQINAQTQLPEQGSGERYVIDATYGKVSDRGSFSISAQYAEQKALNAADRDWSRCPTSQRWTDQAFSSPPDGAQVGDGVLDNTDPVTGKPLCFGFIYGLASTALGYLRYEPTLSNMNDTANPYYDPRVAYYYNAVGGSAPYWTRMPVDGLSSVSWPLMISNNSTTTPIRPLYDNQGAYYRDELSPGIANIQSPSKLFSATSFGQLDFDLGAGQSTAYYEAYYNERKTTSTYGYRQFFPWVWALTDESYSGGPLQWHPYNPLQELELLGGLGSGYGDALPVLPTYNLLDPAARIDVKRYNVFAGLRGDLAGSWDYDIVAGYGHSKGTYKQWQFLDDRVYAATNRLRTQPDGSVTCDPSALAEFPDCVPVNLFTEDALLRGILPADALAFMTKYTSGSTVYEGMSLSAYVTGDLFNVPAGTVKAVFGTEYRDESIDDVPDIEAQNGNYWGYTSAGITKGDDQVTELFTEVEVPLLTNMRYADDLYFSGSLRWTDYQSYGNDTTYRVALNYQVTPQFLLRSTYGTSFRAPDLYEQFLADNTGYVSSLNDPCSDYGSGSLQPGDPVYDNCAAQGLAPDYRATSSILAITGGASDLTAETSDALTIGLVVTPTDSDLSFAIDYFDIEIKNTVESPSVGYILSQCYNSVDFSSPFCNRVGPRDPNNDDQLSYVDSSFVNVGKQRSRGYDFNFLYEHQFETGKLTWDASMTYLDKQSYVLFDEFIRLEGRWGYPRLSANTQIRYDWRDWRFGWFVNFIGASKEAPVYDPGTTDQDRQNRTPNYLVHTASVRYQQADWEAIFSVRNVFDKDPPYVADGQGSDGATRIYNTLPGTGYDLFGRTYVVQLSYKF